MDSLFHYSNLSKKTPVLLLPDDVTMRSDLAELIPKIPAVILRENQFLGFLNGQPTLPLTAPPLKPRNRFNPFKCKCCGLEGKQRNRGPSGSGRSYCMDCELLIPDMEFDRKLNRWVNQRQFFLPTPLVPAPLAVVETGKTETAPSAR